MERYAVLGFLDKGHTRGRFPSRHKTFRELGITLHPTFVPFHAMDDLGWLPGPFCE